MRKLIALALTLIMVFAASATLAEGKLVVYTPNPDAEIQYILNTFAEKYGMTGWAPTQGHIPSGVPAIGYFVDEIKAGKLNKCMIIGKGSLFLGRMTNLFDGVSFVIQKNSGASEAATAGVSEEEVKGMIAKAMKEFAATLMAQAE